MRYYFASKITDLDGKTICPKIPKSIMKSENKTTKRICVSQSINGCLTSISDFCIGDIVTVYSCEPKCVLQPTREDVEDSPLTGEMWIVEPVRLELFMVVEINGIIDTALNQMMNTLYGFKLREDLF